MMFFSTNLICQTSLQDYLRESKLFGLNLHVSVETRTVNRRVLERALHLLLFNDVSRK